MMKALLQEKKKCLRTWSRNISSRYILLWSFCRRFLSVRRTCFFSKKKIPIWFNTYWIQKLGPCIIAGDLTSRYIVSYKLRKKMFRKEYSKLLKHVQGKGLMLKMTRTYPIYFSKIHPCWLNSSGCQVWNQLHDGSREDLPNFFKRFKGDYPLTQQPAKKREGEREAIMYFD